MATLTIRNLDERTKTKLRIRAASHGRSMKEEARTILRAAMDVGELGESRQGLGSRIHAHFARLGSVDLELPDRASQSVPALLDDEVLTTNQGGSDEAREAVQ